MSSNAFMQFDQKATSYDTYSQAQQFLAQWGSQRLSVNTQPEAKVLELGAGTGIFTQQLLQHFTSVQATDSSPNMVAIGKSKYPQADWTSLDAWNLPHTKKWDFIASSALLQWCQDPAQTLKQWAQCLTEHGKNIRLLLHQRHFK